jgi:hypothetical protein
MQQVINNINARISSLIIIRDLMYKAKVKTLEIVFQSEVDGGQLLFRVDNILVDGEEIYRKDEDDIYWDKIDGTDCNLLFGCLHHLLWDTDGEIEKITYTREQLRHIRLSKLCKY